jgi:hypothetical protein
MKTFLFTLKFRIASVLINLGIMFMPDCVYKREMCRRLIDLQVEMINWFGEENENGNK